MSAALLQKQIMFEDPSSQLHPLPDTLEQLIEQTVHSKLQRSRKAQRAT